ncbi:uncharacterized protein LOC103708619 isoform X1 [Phoenix dactylifera]|uniref:Uncharacterized protein LOC103708619 isoform X1 n=1 Tax=Phoenix dactylifera TaxID=42345 RepID=A0A8B7C4W0_PHODC|nr:uncharacterized protein LOC103708619 isoform X1 [Phoenix dactylifera]
MSSFSNVMGGHKPTKPFHDTQRWRAVALASLVLVLVTSTIIIKGKPSSPSGVSNLKSNSFHTSIQFQPSVEFMNGTNLIWQIPKSPKAVLFLAHGCNGQAANFWDKSPSCQNCVGLPEERLIVLHALERRFAVLSVSSLGRCWSFGKEKENVKWIIKWWIEKNKLEKLPVTALGASSGGYFVSALAAEIKFSSITIMIAEGRFDSMAIPESYPPTLFVHMPKDRIRAELILMNMEALRQKGIPVKEIRCMQFPLAPELLSDKIPGLDQTLSVRLFKVFHEKGFIDKNGYMRNDGRAIPWKQALMQRNLLLKKHELVKHIEEELNLAFAYHEMTSLQSDDIFDWFESHMN